MKTDFPISARISFVHTPTRRSSLAHTIGQAPPRFMCLASSYIFFFSPCTIEQNRALCFRGNRLFWVWVTRENQLVLAWVEGVASSARWGCAGDRKTPRVAEGKKWPVITKNRAVEAEYNTTTVAYFINRLQRRSPSSRVFSVFFSTRSLT